MRRLGIDGQLRFGPRDGLGVPAPAGPISGEHQVQVPVDLVGRELVHRAGDEGQVDFFEVTVELDGQRCKRWMFVLRLMFRPAG